MTKTLKRRFIVTAMIAISFLLVVLLSIINIINYWFNDSESDRILNILADPHAPFHLHRSPSFPGDNNKIFSPPPNDNTRLSAIQFTVETDSNGEIFDIDLSRISTISEEEAGALFKKALSENSTYGKIESFKYKSVNLSDGKTKYVFLDITTQQHIVLRVLIFSLVAGLFVWLLMLLLVVLLSKRAIEPIAKNIEKQKQFVTDAGHEIKTPLAIILANTEALELRSGESKWSKNIKNQVSRLDGLMKNLLTLSKADEANNHIQKAEFDLSALLTETTHMFKEPAQLRNLTFECNIPENISLISNKEHITRIISILLDNAVKYAKNGTSIGILLKKTEKSTELSVRNECETLPSCDAEKLFDRFYREDSARTQKSGGYGIGLSAARALSNLCNVSLSASYDNGSSITFTIKF
ncbi:MAG: HAMP domain-containing histidine kinase [Oscillospiraceae bacterium]|nr:HAMP domain-containing histidine kinase [Oscillospiraceae bacterium]